MQGKCNLTNADFIKSVVDTNDLEQSISEVVFLGRSNVGKSSLLNALTNRKNLAKKSQTPGKTRTINCFDINYQDESKQNFKCMFVDLPGIGYARVSKSIKEEWSKYLNNFINKRDSIRIFIYLIDSRHIDLDTDRDIISRLNGMLKSDQLLLKVYTKSDKLNQSDRSKLLAKDKEALLVSSTNFKGISKINDTIFDFLFNFTELRSPTS